MVVVCVGEGPFSDPISCDSSKIREGRAGRGWALSSDSSGMRGGGGGWGYVANKYNAGPS